MPSYHDPVASARAAVAGRTRHHPEDRESIAEARSALAAAKIERYIQRVVAEAPPLSEAQRDQLAVLLRGAPVGAP